MRLVGAISEAYSRFRVLPQRLRGLGWGFWLTVLLAALLRFAWLGRASYTIDESELVKIAASYSSIREIFRNELERFTFLHRLPLPIAVFWFFTRTDDLPVPPEHLTRLPMAILGVLTVAMMAGWGGVFRDRRIGFWASFLCAISFFHVFYSREAYDYSLLIFLANAVFLTGVWFCREVLVRESFPWRVGLVHSLFAALLLQCHLSALLFLSCLYVALVLVVGKAKGLGVFLRGRGPSRWITILGLPYFVFLPFLLKLAGGFEVTESDIAKRFSLAVFPALWGRMGWGEGIVPLLLFTFFWGLGCLWVFRVTDKPLRLAAILCFAGMALYFAVQSWMLRVSRFEIRYYSPLFPLLVIFAGAGLAFAENWLTNKRGAAAAKRAKLFAVVVLLLWSTPSLWWILRLECRGFANFKGIARWINENVPRGGIYAFLNVYDLRGVPRTYPTPERFGTCVAYWSSKQERIQAKPVERTRQFFTKFPTAYFVEIAPRDLLVPEVAEDFIPRSELFSRSVWLTDPAFDRLVQWKTLPLGNTQYNATNEHRVLISYNLPDDLPALAKRRGRSLYHYYGAEWTYFRDEERRDWMVARDLGMIWLGNATEQPVRARVSFWASGSPDRCRISISWAGKILASNLEVPSYAVRVPLSPVTVPPGKYPLVIRILDASTDGERYIGISDFQVQPHVQRTAESAVAP